MHRNLLAAVVAFASASSCPPTPGPSALVRCNRACAHLVELGCSGLAPAGTSCDAFCAQLEKLGHRMPTECVEHATNCEQADQCN